MTAHLGHRVRCITVKAGIVNTCPECGQRTVTDWTWDFAFDPHPEDGPIDVNEEFADELAEIGSNTALPCLPSCEECRT